jgi:protochlorophyllide reductase
MTVQPPIHQPPLDQPPTIAPPRRILLTGASSGIGFEAARLLLQAGHALILPCRDQPTAAATIERLMAARSIQGPFPKLPWQPNGAPLASSGPGASESIHAPVCDLADLASVEHCAAELLRRGTPIDTLVLNAGLQEAGAPEPRRSAQDYELTIAVNHLAHQALSQRLLPLLDAGNSPRVVVTASEVHDPGTAGGRVGLPAGLGNLEGLRAGAGFAMVDGQSPFNAEKAYKDSKLCNLLFARELARLLRQRGTPMPVLAWSPGLVIPRDEGGFFRYSRRHNPWGQRLFALVARDLLRITASPEQAGSLLAALATDPEAHDGFCYGVNRLLGPGRLRFEPAEPSVEARDDRLANALWQVSADLVGLAAELSPLA